jgi:hypothetical protein
MTGKMSVGTPAAPCHEPVSKRSVELSNGSAAILRLRSMAKPPYPSTVRVLEGPRLGLDPDPAVVQKFRI